ncbi:MAG: aldehyde dehydrogenase [Verrucomicrobia bacterium]|nr:aldehyde dehydrogenase [Verrucomicrobiota bacterium]
MDFSHLIQRQRALFQTGATRPFEYRRAQLVRLRDALRTHESRLLEALHADLRKSAYDAFATELGLVQSEIGHALRNLSAWMKAQRRRTPMLTWPARGWIRPEPYGVALIMGPWNYPVQLLLSPLVGAIAAGNCAVLKPSELAPQTAAALTGLVGDTFASDYVAMVQGEHDTAEALLREKFDVLFFTGSTPVGRAVMAAAARHLTPVTLELGGKCPCLVCADAPLEVTARRIVWGKFLNTGQTCVAPDFVLVDRRRTAGLVEAMRRALVEFYGAEPRQSPDYGRIVNERHFARLTGYLARGQIAHGGQHDAADLYLAPTLLTEVPADAPVLQEEIFGPILPVIEFERLDEALGRLRDRPIPLALYLFTRDRATQGRVLATTRSGGVCLNDTLSHMVGLDLPFGGVGESGLGRYHGQASFEAFTHRRTVLRRSLAVDPSLRYPPPRIGLAALKRAWRFLLGG